MLANTEKSKRDEQKLLHEEPAFWAVLSDQVFNSESISLRFIEDMPMSQKVFLLKEWSRHTPDLLESISSKTLSWVALTDIEKKFLLRRLSEMDDSSKKAFERGRLDNNERQDARKFLLYPLLEFKLMNTSAYSSSARQKALNDLGLGLEPSGSDLLNPAERQAYADGLCSLSELEHMHDKGLAFVNKYKISYTKLKALEYRADEFIFTPTDDFTLHYSVSSTVEHPAQLGLLKPSESFCGCILCCIPWHFSPMNTRAHRLTDWLSCVCTVQLCCANMPTVRSQRLHFKAGFAYELSPRRWVAPDYKQWDVPGQNMYDLKYQDEQYGLEFWDIERYLKPFGTLVSTLELAVSYEQNQSLELGTHAPSPPPIYGHISSASSAQSHTPSKEDLRETQVPLLKRPAFEQFSKKYNHKFEKLAQLGPSAPQREQMLAP